MKILLLGKNGQVGWELQRSLQPIGDIIALNANSPEYCGDLTNLAGLADTIQKVQPDVIVNSAAYTAVDKAQAEPELAKSVNALAPGVLAKEAFNINALLIHYSTDYVFDGKGQEPWTETDIAAPLNVYGETKLLGEQLIQNSGCQHIILRTSWVYGTRGKNFIKTMMQLAKERDSLSVIDDQSGAPTGADLIADITAHIIPMAKSRAELSGLYHLVSAGETSWYRYACFVLDFVQKSGVSLKVAVDSIKAVPTDAFPTPAKRPYNSRLNTEKVQKTFSLNLPIWQTGVQRALTEILDK